MWCLLYNYVCALWYTFSKTQKRCYTKIEIAGFGKIEIAGYNRILDYNPIKNDREINSYEFKSIY